MKRVLAELGPVGVKNLFAVRAADIAAQSPAFEGDRNECMHRAMFAFSKILADNEAYSIKDLAVSGRDLIALGLEPGP